MIGYYTASTSKTDCLHLAFHLLVFITSIELNLHLIIPLANRHNLIMLSVQCQPDFTCIAHYPGKGFPVSFTCHTVSLFGRIIATAPISSIPRIKIRQRRACIYRRIRRT